MQYWKILLLLIEAILLSNAVDPPCRDEICYDLLNQDINSTQELIGDISNSLDRINFNLTATIEQLDEARMIVNETFWDTLELNMTEMQLLSQFTTVRDEIVYSQQQLMNISIDLELISDNVTEAEMMSSDAVTIVNQIIDHISRSIAALDNIEANLLPIIESISSLTEEQADNGTQLYAELQAQLMLVTNQSLELFNISHTALSIANATVELLITTSALQENVSSGIITEMMNSQNVSMDLESLTDDLTSIRNMIQFLTNNVSMEAMNTYPVISMDQISQRTQEAIQLAGDLRSLLMNISVLIDLRRSLDSALNIYVQNFDILAGLIQTLEQESVQLCEDSSQLYQQATNATRDSEQLIGEAQNLQMELANFSLFVERANQSLQDIEMIRTTALNAIDTANNISNMILDTYQTVSDSLLLLMESSNLAQLIQMVLDSFDAQVTYAINSTEDDIAALGANRVSLEMAQDKVDNETTDLTNQQGSINTAEIAVGNADSRMLNETGNCDNANASVMELQSRFDNLSLLCEEDITDVRNRLAMVESQLTMADIENMITQLSTELQQQRNVVDMLETEIEGITTERDLIRQVYDSLPQSCNDVA